MAKFTIINNLDDSRIIPFLMADERSSVYHHPGWLQALSEAYKFDYFYLFIESENGDLIGLQPFIFKSKPLTGKKKIVSLPFTTHCEFLLNDQIALNKVVEFLPLKFGTDVEIDFRMTEELTLNGFSSTSNFLLHKIELGKTIEETYNSFGRRSIRRFIRKAHRNNLKLRFGNSINDLKIFYKLELMTRKKIGFPPAPFRFFYSVWKHLNKFNLILLPIIEYESKPIASSLVLKFKDTFYFEYTGLDRNYIHLYPNHKLHWDIIKIAQEKHKARYINLGRCSDTNEGLKNFKQNWNAKPYKIYHTVNSPQKITNSADRNIKFIKKFNSLLPDKLLELEGRIIYPFLD